jgi:hypothetical protein
MVRIFVLAAVLSFATAAHGAESKPKSTSTQKGKTGTAGKPSDAQRDLMNAKRTLKTAVDLCSVPGKCEQGSSNADREFMSMLEGADRSFIEACMACSTAEKCDAERDRIRAGKRSAGWAPCE